MNFHGSKSRGGCLLWLMSKIFASADMCMWCRFYLVFSQNSNHVKIFSFFSPSWDYYHVINSLLVFGNIQSSYAGVIHGQLHHLEHNDLSWLKLSLPKNVKKINRLSISVIICKRLVCDNVLFISNYICSIIELSTYVFCTATRNKKAKNCIWQQRGIPIHILHRMHQQRVWE